MFLTIVAALIVLAFSFVFLAITILLKKGGKFPNTHIGASKAMAERGIKCAATQDREAQKTTK